ncbi:hypothetical protein Bhyg_03735 [Pseudolycoriella hygida]|uniref:F-box domain-containing protein n=1 Tax=Pseudolycoriella hygida TaxID=35572 RepID=A0A9Q0S9Q2_9DIPT|nr:hypothetical protein Bhyg_03735 [Pseudolycoriella hygida]
MSCEESEMTLISLNDDVLLHIFKFLNWIDSINLAATCTRMNGVKYYEVKKNQEFDLKEYLEKATVPIEELLPVIGPYLQVVKITGQVISESFMEKCVNVRSLKIDECNSQNTAITLNKWMKTLTIESLFIGQYFETYVKELLDGISGLKTFTYECYWKLPRNFLLKNSTIQHLLLIPLDYNLSPLRALDSLQSLYIKSSPHMIRGLLNAIQQYVKFDNLKEFSMHCLDDRWNAGDADAWNNFAENLAKRAKLENLNLIGGVFFIYKATLSILNLFDLKSLCLDVGFTWHDFSTMLQASVAPRLKYVKLQWPLEYCCSEKIGNILQIWTNVEAICLQDIDGPNHQLQFDDEFFSDIFKILNRRLGLRIHMSSNEICLNFISKRYYIIKKRQSCACKDSFQLSDTVTCFD